MSSSVPPLQERERVPPTFATIAEEVFAPAYPVIAKSILEQTGLSRGVCLDLGTGPGHLGRAMLAICPHLQIILYDCSEKMLTPAKEYNQHHTRPKQLHLHLGRAETLPYRDEVSISLSAVIPSFSGRTRLKQSTRSFASSNMRGTPISVAVLATENWQNRSGKQCANACPSGKKIRRERWHTTSV